MYNSLMKRRDRKKKEKGTEGYYKWNEGKN